MAGKSLRLKYSKKFGFTIEIVVTTKRNRNGMLRTEGTTHSFMFLRSNDSVVVFEEGEIEEHREVIMKIKMKSNINECLEEINIIRG